jgi:glycosyltransferase involved in cell wall biosynthesis
MPKLVSIIFPTKCDKITHTLDSLSNLVNQSYQSWEVIVLKPSDLDFNSLFGFIYEDNKEKFKIIDVSNELSIGEIRNIGISNSRGSYIAYLDDDDLWSNDYLKVQVEELEKTGCDLVYCNYHLRLQEFNNIDNKYFQHFISIPYRVNPFDRNVLLTESFICLSGVLHTKNVTDTIKFKPLNSYEDWAFFLTASKMFKFHSFSEPLLTVQKRLDNTNNKTRLGNESIRNIRQIFKETSEEIKDNDVQNIREVILSQIIKEHKSFSQDEIDYLQIMLEQRGIEFAFRYLKYIFSIGKIDAYTCKKGYDIVSSLGNKELSNDLLFLFNWYEGIETEEFKDYKPTYFERKSQKWIALL